MGFEWFAYGIAKGMTLFMGVMFLIEGYPDNPRLLIGTLIFFGYGIYTEWINSLPNKKELKCLR